MANLKAFLPVLLLAAAAPGYSADPPVVEYRVFQFPPHLMPNIDGKTDDWKIVGEDYTYRSDRLDCSQAGHGGPKMNTSDIDVSVRVGWVKGLNRLYFLYEAYDDFWDFDQYSEKRGYQNDIFEISLDGDLSSGPFIQNPRIKDKIENHMRFSGVHAQNYHIFTPPVNNQWCMVWGSNPWIAWFPWAHQAYDYKFKHGESGRLTLEFWVTPFDYAPSDGPERAVVSKLIENQTIGLSWAILDFDHGKKDAPGHCNLAHDMQSVKDASVLPVFRLMPVETSLLPPIEARFSFLIVDPDRRLVYFKDESVGEVSKWKWNFGDGATSAEKSPLHQYAQPGIYYNVLLEVEGPGGVSRHSRHWQVNVR